MPTRLNADHVRESLNAHVAEKGWELHSKYGPNIGDAELRRILEDRACVRYPCELVFDASPLQAGECAHPVPRGHCPEDGFTMYVHPRFQDRPTDVAYLVLYQLVLVNYGEFVGAEDAETFGAAALGLSKEDYYQALCKLTDEPA